MDPKPAVRFVLLCVATIVAMLPSASALTISYSGVLTWSELNDLYSPGDAWQLTAVFPDPLTASPGGADPAQFNYVPSSLVLTINGAIVCGSDFMYSADLLALYDATNVSPNFRYYNYLSGMGLDFTPFISVGLGSEAAVTAPDNGLLVPGLPLSLFDTNAMYFGNFEGGSGWVGGTVTAYSIPDAASTMVLLSLGFAAIGFLRRRIGRCRV